MPCTYILLNFKTQGFNQCLVMVLQAYIYQRISNVLPFQSEYYISFGWSNVLNRYAIRVYMTYSLLSPSVLTSITIIISISIITSALRNYPTGLSS